MSTILTCLRKLYPTLDQEFAITFELPPDGIDARYGDWLLLSRNHVDYLFLRDRGGVGLEVRISRHGWDASDVANAMQVNKASVKKYIEEATEAAALHLLLQFIHPLENALASHSRAVTLTLIDRMQRERLQRDIGIPPDWPAR